MGIPIAELQERVSSREFAEYWAAYQLDPWGPELEDHRTGIVASTIANVNRDPKKRPRPYTPDDFTPRFGAAVDDEEPTEEELEARAAAIDEVMASIGGDESEGPA